MTRFSITALLLSILGAAASVYVAFQVFDAVPHLEDEIAYVWQAQALAKGKLTIPSPPEPKSFLVPFVIDHEGQRFGKYPIGWPAVLAPGVLLGARWLVNPLLAGLGIWLTYLLGRRVFGEIVGLIAAGLTLVSPFFLLNSGSLLSHPLGLVLAAGFALAYLEGFGERRGARRWRFTLLAGFLLGFLVLTRPFTALGVALPFALHGVYLLFAGGADPASRWQTRLHLVSVGVLVLLIGSLHFAWQYRVTGDPLLNPYTLWWPYDKVGFGEGYGVSETGHSLRKAWVNTRHSLESGYGDLFGWGQYSWVMLPFGMLAALLRRNGRALLLGSVIVVLVVIYMAYWVGSSLFGPRYYYEGLFSLTLFSAAGIAFLAGLPVSPGPKDEPAPLADGDLPPSPGASRFPKAENVLFRLSPARPWLVFGGIAILTAFSLAVYTPTRLGHMHALYEISQENYEPFRTPEALALPPSLFIVHTDKWMPYGALIELQDPCLTSHFIFAWSRGPRTDARLAELFPDREVFHYYPEEPFVFYRERHEAAPGN